MKTMSNRLHKITKWAARRIKRRLRGIVSQEVITRVVNRIKSKPKFLSTLWFVGFLSRHPDFSKTDIGWYLYVSWGKHDDEGDPPWQCENFAHPDFEDPCDEACYPDPEHGCSGWMDCSTWESLYPEWEPCDCLLCPKHGEQCWNTPMQVTREAA